MHFLETTEPSAYVREVHFLETTESCAYVREVPFLETTEPCVYVREFFFSLITLFPPCPIAFVVAEEADIRAPLKIGIRRLFASGQSPTGKIFGGYLQVATLKSSCIGLFAHSLKIHPIEF